MKKSILVVDWLLVIIFVLMVVSRFLAFSLPRIVQPIFFILILIHIVQHWRVMFFSLRGLVKKNETISKRG